MKKYPLFAIMIACLLSACKENDTPPEGDAHLDTLWEKTYFFENEMGIRDDYSATAFALSETTSGDLLVAGWASNTDGRHELDGFTLVTHPDGGFKQGHYVDEGSLFGITPTSDGGMAVAGVHETESTGVITNRLFRYDANGNPALDQWGVDFGRRAVAELPGGDLLALSDYALSRWSPDGGMVWSSPLIPNGPIELRQDISDSPLLVLGNEIIALSTKAAHRFDFDGNPLGEIRFLECDDCVARSISPLENGGLLVTGSVSGEDVDIPGYQGGHDIFLAAFDANGELEWQRLYGGGDADRGLSAKATPDGGQLLLISSYSTNGDLTDWVGEVTGLELRTFLLKTNASGDVEWMRRLGSAHAMRQLSDGDYVVAGNVEEMVGGTGRFRVWMMRFGLR